MSKHIRFKDEVEDEEEENDRKRVLEDGEMSDKIDDQEDLDDQSSLSSSSSSRKTYKLTLNIILKKDVKRRESSFGFQLKGC